jgi:hypothetical protein
LANLLFAERAGEDQERKKSNQPPYDYDKPFAHFLPPTVTLSGQTLVFARNPPDYLLQKVLLKNA